MKAIDTSAPTNSKAQHIKELGYGAVGVYLRPDRCTLPMIQELQQAGLKIWSIYEKGTPTHDSYFSAAKGTSDGQAAASFASSLGQPAGSQIYATVDYDASEAAASGPIAAYMEAFEAAVAASHYVASIYASGRTCRILLGRGHAKTGWLTQSTGFAEYRLFKPKAGIVQLPALSSSWDGDEIVDVEGAGLW